MFASRASLGRKFCSQACQWESYRREDGGPYRNVKQGLKSKLVLREGGRCQDCGCSAEDVGGPLEAHHVVPQSLGGDNTLGNLSLLCHDCHRGSGWERNHSLLLMSGLVYPKAAA